MNGKRKFYAYMISIGVFLILMGFVVYKTPAIGDATIAGIIIAFGGAITGIAGAFYAGNFGEHYTKKDNNVNQ